jgi:hypothetical protein
LETLADLLGACVWIRPYVEVPETKDVEASVPESRLLLTVALLGAAELLVPIIAESSEAEVVRMPMPERTVDEDGEPPAGKGNVGLSRQSSVMTAVAEQSAVA